MSNIQIVTVVLINGAEIIGKLVTSDDTSITLNKPRMVQVAEEGLAMSPGVCMTGEEPKGDFEINKSGVLFCIPTLQQLANQYEKMTSSILMPKSGGIIK